MEDLLATTSPDYLKSIKESRDDYQSGRVTSHMVFLILMDGMAAAIAAVKYFIKTYTLTEKAEPRKIPS
ncbi:MAG: hypothetical protein LC660_08365 [Desulfobacteraceae bacterium]|nr:hypothetical protein [Desulfobacteraceae bacterium]